MGRTNTETRDLGLIGHCSRRVAGRIGMMLRAPNRHLIVAFTVIAGLLYTQHGAWAQGAGRNGLPNMGLTYDISVSVDMETRRFSGQERITWRNPGSRPVDRIPMHLYLNAFANGASTWLTEQRGGRGLRFLDDRLPEDSWGFNEPRKITRVSGDTVRDLTWSAVQPDDGNEADRTLIEIALRRPVAPGETLTLDVTFEGRLPEPIARTGCIPDMCFFAQWFPKLGAFETANLRGGAVDGFAARQFHSSTEFYANFADYTVTINAPTDFTIGATGARTEERGEDGRQIVTYRQNAVTDFAFTVGRFDEYTSTFDPNGEGPTVAVRYLAYADRGFALERAITAVHGSLRVLNEKLGAYPYETLTVVYPPIQGAAVGGMEYPTLFTGIAVDPVFFNPPLDQLGLLETVDIHEFGHQYFQHLLATNEQLEAFMDEGFNSYWEGVIKTELFGKERSGGAIFGRPIDDLLSERSSDTFPRLREALAKSPSNLFYSGTSGTQIYSRPSVTLRTAAGLFGEERLHSVFRTYFQRWRFKHPSYEDFMAVVSQVGGADMEAFLREGFSARRHPDFRVRTASSRPYAAPVGRYERPGDEPLVLTQDNAQDHKSLLITDRARETDGLVWAQITDPGYVRASGTQDGAVSWQSFAPTLGSVDVKTGDADFFETIVRVSGPGWDHLPIDVVFEFEDGVTIQEVWDGRAAWRQYRFLRGAKLKAVRLDPDNKIALDYDIKNNSRLLDPDPDLARDMTAWAGALFQTFLSGLWGAL